MITLTEGYPILLPLTESVQLSGDGMGATAVSRAINILSTLERESRL